MFARRKLLTLAVALGIGLSALPLASMPARAQDNGSTDISNKKVSLNLENADIRYALKLLFDSVGANYTLDPSVQGSVTVKLSDVPFRVALESTLRSAGSAAPLTYRVENGVYNIAPKVETAPTTDTNPPDTNATTTPRKLPTKIFLQYADAIDIARNLGGGVIVSRLSSMGGGGGGMGMGGMMGGMGGMGGGMGMGGMMGGGMGGGMGGFGGGMGGMGGGGFGGGGMGGFGGGGFGGGFGGGGMGGGGFGR